MLLQASIVLVSGHKSNEMSQNASKGFIETARGYFWYVTLADFGDMDVAVGDYLDQFLRALFNISCNFSMA